MERLAGLGLIASRGSAAARFDNFAVVIPTPPEARHRAVELTRTSSCARVRAILDPSLTDGSRELRLDAAPCDGLLARLTRRFPPRGAPVVG